MFGQQYPRNRFFPAVIDSVAARLCTFLRGAAQPVSAAPTIGPAHRAWTQPCKDNNKNASIQKCAEAGRARQRGLRALVVPTLRCKNSKVGSTKRKQAANIKKVHSCQKKASERRLKQMSYVGTTDMANFSIYDTIARPRDGVFKQYFEPSRGNGQGNPTEDWVRWNGTYDHQEYLMVQEEKREAGRSRVALLQSAFVRYDVKMEGVEVALKVEMDLDDAVQTPAQQPSSHWDSDMEGVETTNTYATSTPSSFISSAGSYQPAGTPYTPLTPPTPTPAAPTFSVLMSAPVSKPGSFLRSSSGRGRAVNRVGLGTKADPVVL